MKVGIVGVGTMGSRMAVNMVQAGFRVLARDIDPQAEERARSLGTTVVPSPAEVAKQAEIVLLSLPGPSDVATVVLGEDGLLTTAGAGQVIVDLSTVDPLSTRRNAGEASQRGVGYLDAPVLGRPQKCGNWTLPVGGNEADLAKCRPVLAALAQRILFVGESGNGNIVKLLNNLMFGAINSITAEIMALSAQVGMNPKILFDTIAESGAASVSNLFLELGPKMLARDYSPLFAIDLLHKDNKLAIEMAQEAGMPLILSRTSQLLNEMARSKGLGSEDTSAVVKVYEDLLQRKVQA